jgi:hypothetical protein
MSTNTDLIFDVRLVVAPVATSYTSHWPPSE